MQSIFYQIIELNACKENLHSQRLSFSNSSKGGHQDLSDIMVRLEKKREELLNSRIELVHRNLEIQQCISNLNPDERDLLNMRYIKKWHWDEIAAALGYSESHVKGYIHGKALKHLDLSSVVQDCTSKGMNENGGEAR